MAEQISGTNKQKLLEGRGGKAPYQQSSDLFVANAGEKRYLWTARAFAIITALSICCNIVLILAIFQVMPLYRVEPFLLTFQDRSEQVYHIQPIMGGLRSQKAITEVFVREYVLLRSSFSRDLQEMESRWGPEGQIKEMSSPRIYDDFVRNTAKKALEIIRSRGLSREVKILSVNELANGIWQVEYETRDMYPESVRPEVNYWTAAMNVRYRRKSVKFGDRLKNPVGFTVDKYSLTFNKVE
ncbi:MAG: type IV secretion system protein [Alphaproteobacteria bacterium]|nr:type IV secretion system protein [Alphaproteobacteria bacterium]